MKIAKKDLEWAASKGVIDDSQAAALWQALSDRTADHAKFDLIHVAYYFGVLLVIGAMGWFLGTKWEVFGGAGIFAISVSYAAAFVVAGAVLWHRSGLRVPGGLLITMAVCMTSYARKLVTAISGGVFDLFDAVLERHSLDEFGQLV